MPESILSIKYELARPKGIYRQYSVSSNIYFLFYDNEAQLLTGQTTLEVAVLNLSITDAFDLKTFLHLGFSQTSITQFMDHGGLTSAQGVTVNCPKNPGDPLEIVNCLFGNSFQANAKIYFPPGKMMKLKAPSSYFRCCFTANRISEVRLIGYVEVSTFGEYMKVCVIGRCKS